MADKVEKPKKKAKPKKDEKGVLAALPSTRPERIGTRRSTPAAAAEANPAPAKRAKAKRAPAKAAARPAASRRKAAAPRTFEPTEAAEAAAGAADERAAGAVPRTAKPSKPKAKPKPERSYPRPRPVREGAPGIGTGGYRDQPSESGRPTGVEIASTAVKAAGEVAQFGFTLGGKALKRVVDRLPKP